ncbi:mandelate racemase/muconate lactonizing enzyme family protein [Brevundimonas sp.]|uniref:mandelate racemase/muconate lactonizing enzyme family protein n=1 Tax=Brevundimonas sp. TaxID=1871086 RepID=UPI002737B447|nr:enolase C-terminal domain-like protein [Brevundimonas sp.]MDP3801076.1 enolase C-terminal domain-like protein [Brevundimonas sp.]
MPPKVSLASLDIPFRHAFAHASAVRRRAANVLVRVEDGAGCVGYGEGSPRAYVTGETVEGAMAFLADRASSIAAEVGDVDQLRRWLAAHEPLVDARPSAVCALEMALLDLFARRAGRSVEALLGVAPLTTPMQVSAVYGVRSNMAFHVLAWRFGRAGLGDAKLKLTGRPEIDGARVRRLARRGPVRLDANNLWPDARSAIAGLTVAASAGAWAVEEPVAARDWPAMVAAARGTGLAIVLDESFLTLHDLEAAPSGTRWIANVRVSKLGGVMRTLAAIAAARARGLPLIVGAHVGETSLAARAGLLAAAACGEALRAVEIGYGPHLLAHDPFVPAVSFDRRGMMDPPPAGPGWGVAPDAAGAGAFS